MSDVISTIGEGFEQSFLMAYEVWWALVLGFAISAVVQSWVPRQRVESALSGSGLGPLAKATGLGAASSSCSYAAIAIAKSLFQKGASTATALAFQFASTNLVWELGLVMWILIGWQFTLAEFVGGVVLITLMAALLRLFVSPRAEQAAREHAERAQAAHQHHMAGEQMSWRQRLSSARAWSDVAHKLVLNLLALVAFSALFYLTMRRGVTDPVCGMKVDRAKALRLEHAGRIYFFCSEHCRGEFEANPERYTQPGAPPVEAHAARHAH